MIIGNSIKGKGVFMENKPIWHCRSQTTQEYQLAIKEIK